MLYRLYPKSTDAVSSDIPRLWLGSFVGGQSSLLCLLSVIHVDKVIKPKSTSKVTPFQEAKSIVLV